MSRQEHTDDNGPKNIADNLLNPEGGGPGQGDSPIKGTFSAPLGKSEKQKGGASGQGTGDDKGTFATPLGAPKSED